ncbi:MAG: hypothetical protein AB9846_16945 [Tenuifilaceae bacterium]
MRLKVTKIIAVAIIILISNSLGFSQNNQDSIKISSDEIKKFIENSNVSAQIFLGYRYYEEGKNNFNEFAIKRGYITFRKSINKYISGRITPDITIDKEGDGMGDVEMRLKYCYMEFKTPGGKFFSDPSILFGEVFTPWIEFEEKINSYRVQGSHYLDRVGIISSADFGTVFTTLFGGKMDETYQKQVSKSYPGKFGSMAIGVYNGGGYHALEENNNKTFQWRFTLRPLTNHLPGLQLSYLGATGKGNTSLNPEWNLRSGHLSYEHQRFILTGQIYKSKGDFEGILSDSTGNAYNNNGYSLFSEVKLFEKKISIFGRYDFQKVNMDGNFINSKRLIGGIAYHIYGKNKIIIDFDHFPTTGKENVGIIELMVELAF